MKTYKGFVAIPRDVQIFPLWENPHDTVLWLYCLLHASHRAYRELQPGQFYASQKKIAEEMGWSRKTIGLCLRRLQGKKMLDIQTSDRGTIITVCHWEEISSGRGLCADQYEDTGGERENSANDQQMDNDALRSEQFERFWSAYPRKSNKAEARRIFMNMTDDPERVISATLEAKVTVEWNTENGRFIPNPVKWLDGRWEQYAPPPKTRKSELWTTTW